MSGDRPRILHLVYEDSGGPTGGMGLHVQHLTRLTKEYADVAVVQIDQHTHAGAFWRVDDGGWYEYPYRCDERGFPETPEGWVSEVNTFRVLSCFPTNDIDVGYDEKLQRFVAHQLFERNTLRHLSDFRADIIHLHDAHLWRVAEALRALWRCKTAITVHLSILLSNPCLSQYPENLYSFGTELSAYSKADACICVSKCYRELVQRRCFRDDALYAIYNGVDYAALAAVEYDMEMRARYPLDKELVGFVGRLTPQKGLEHIEAAARALPDYHFIVISHEHAMMGCTTQRQFEAATEELPNLQWERHLTQAEKLCVMRVCDIGIVPSNWEPFGIVALEWMSLGVPLIASAVEGLAEFCDERNSTLIEPSGAALTAAIRNHQCDTDQVEKARQTAQSFSWARMAEQTIRVYEETLAAPPRMIGGV